MLSLASENFPWPQHIGLEHIKEIELTDDLLVEQWIIKKGTKIKVAQVRECGFCIVPEGSVPYGTKRVFKY